MAKPEAGNPVPCRQPLRLLIVEDSPSDAELMVAVLKQAGHPISFDLADSPEPFRQHLEQADYDAILADYNLGTWTAMDALQILRQSGKDIPFVVVTGSLGDQAAVDCIKHGATDYVLKDHLDRLPLAVERALHEKAVRQEAARLLEVIHRSKREWELTFDAVPDLVLLLDEQCRIKRANRAAAELLGLKPAQFIGTLCYETLHGLSEPRRDCPHHRLLETGQPQRSEIEEPRLGKFFDVTTTPLRDASGVLLGSVHVMRDITERKQAEKQMEERTTYLNSMIDNSPLGIAVLDSHGFVEMCNAAFERLFHYRQSEVVGAKLDELIATQETASELTQITRRVFTGETVHATTRMRRKDGTLADVELHAVPLIVQGELIGTYNLYQDITERKHLEDQLRQGQKMEAIGRLAGGVAHDFNNILNVIIGYSELLLDHLGPSDPVRKNVEEIKKAGEHAASLTLQLLAFSRKQVLEPKVLDLNAVVAETDGILRRLIGEDIELVSLPEPELGRVKADPGQIQQVILNLALNGRDAMPQGGKLTIETANVGLDETYARRHLSVQPGSYVMLAVSDTGCGMDEDTIPHIFEPFFTTKVPGKGTGLGLATVYGIIKQSGGNIWVYSEPGQGTTFKIYLPRVEEAVEAATPGKTLARPLPGSETVLVVEDAEPLRELARKFLEISGYKVLEAKNGVEAIKIAEQHKGPIHLLLTDVVMPSMSGRELANRLAALRSEMKVLYVSGYTANVIVCHGVLESGTAFLPKPFTRNALAHKVREVLDRNKENP